MENTDVDMEAVDSGGHTAEWHMDCFDKIAEQEKTAYCSNCSMYLYESIIYILAFRLQCC